MLRRERWPDESNQGRPVILPGGEVGILQSWWNHSDVASSAGWSSLPTTVEGDDARVNLVGRINPTSMTTSIR